MLSYGMNVDSLIMQEVVKSFSSESLTLAGVFSGLFTKLPKIFVYIAAKKCIESSSAIMEPIQIFFQALVGKFLYRTETYNTKDLLKEEYHIGSCFLKCNDRKITVTNEDGIVSVKYIPYFHSATITSIIEQGKLDYQNYTESRDKQKVLYETYKLESGCIRGKACTASNLYASSNYRKLATMISSHFETNQLIGVNDVLGILLDGVPGLGKTKFADYAVTEKLAGAVYKIDMTGFISKPFTEVIQQMYHSRAVTVNTIFVIDELDKYFNARLQTEYHELPPENKPTYEQFVQSAKTGYLYLLLSILERDDVRAPTIVIFCSNNFLSIFDGIDTTHHQSLYDRFMKVNFEKCNHTELVNYMEYFNNKLLGTSYYTYMSRQEISRKLNKNVEITYRSLHQLSIMSGYKTDVLIELLNSYKPNVLGTPTSRQDLGQGVGLRQEDYEEEENIDNSNEEEKGEEEEEESEEEETFDTTKDPLNFLIRNIEYISRLPDKEQPMTFFEFYYTIVYGSPVARKLITENDQLNEMIRTTVYNGISSLKPGNTESYLTKRLIEIEIQNGNYLEFFETELISHTDIVEILNCDCNLRHIVRIKMEPISNHLDKSRFVFDAILEKDKEFDTIQVVEKPKIEEEPELTPKQIWVRTIKEYMIKVDCVDTKGERAKIILEIFDYMGSSQAGIEFIEQHPKFKQTVKEKIEDVLSRKENYGEFASQNAKNLIFLMTGIAL